jgi:colanic acid biosynthesis glycosyl transferase WcaI
VVFINRFYWPDIAATSQMLTDLAEELAGQGWRVSVVTTASAYSDAAKRPAGRELHNGVVIHRVRTTRFGRQRLHSRAIDYITFLTGCFFRLLFMPRADIVVALTDPPFSVGVAVLVGKLRRIRVGYWVQDLYPQLAVKLGVLRAGSFLHSGTLWLSRKLLKAADVVVALGPAMRRTLIAAGAHPERTVYVHNWTDCKSVFPVEPENNPFIREHALEGKFVVLYSGNAGRAHTFDVLQSAIRRFRSDPTVVFLFIGGGKYTPLLKATAAAEGWPNIAFLEYVPREQLAFSLSSASVSVVTEKPDVAGLLVPSKTYGIMASGRPILFVGSADSDVADIIREAGCGFVIPSDDADGFETALRRLIGSPELARELGDRGRRAAEQNYDRRIASLAWADAVMNCLPEWSRQQVGNAYAVSNG